MKINFFIKKIFLCVVILSLASTSCSSSSSDSGDGIGPDGGTIEFSGGGHITIPSGALSSSVDISAEEIEATTSEDFTAIGPFYELAPRGQTFAKGVTVSIPYSGVTVDENNIQRLVVMWAHSPGEWEWSHTEVDVDNDNLVSYSNSFTGIGAALLMNNTCEIDNDCFNEGQSLPICHGNNVVRYSCIEQICTLVIHEDCSASNLFCKEGVCGYGVCVNDADCPLFGVEYCAINILKQYPCTDGRCVDRTVEDCSATNKVCAVGSCKDNYCMSPIHCPNSGFPYCNGNVATDWGCEADNTCHIVGTEDCSESGKVCRYGQCTNS